MSRAVISAAIRGALDAAGYANQPKASPAGRGRFQSRQQLPAAWVESAVEEREDISCSSRLGRITFRIVVLLKDGGRDMAESSLAAALARHKALQDAVLTAEIASVESADPPGGEGGKAPYARFHVDYVATYAFDRRSAA